MSGFIKNEELLQENHRVEDLFDFSDYAKSFLDVLNSIKNHLQLDL